MSEDTPSYWVALTPDDRFKMLLDELEKRFPHPCPIANIRPEVVYMQAIDEMIAAKTVGWIDMTKQRPVDEQDIFYVFDPFEEGGNVFAGRYDAENDSVYGRTGFTTMIPEVPYWMPLPTPPEKKNEE